VADDAGSVRLYGRLVGAEVRSAMEYPGPFAASLLTSFAIAALEVVAVAAIFSNVDELVGWSLGEVVLLTGLAQTGFHLAEVTVGQLDHLPDLVRSGRLDTYLLRPRRLLFQVVTQDVDLAALGKLAQSVAVLVVGLAATDVPFGPRSAALLVVSLVGGAVIYAAVWIATTAVTFWLIDSREVSAAFTYGGRQMSMYPLGVYAPSVRTLARYVVPLAFTAYYPALGLIGRDDELGAPAGLAWAGPGVAAVTMVVGLAIWGAGIRAYRSTGA
jgi:ABC-2 type transport system permease protein